jgi:ferredoxin
VQQRRSKITLVTLSCKKSDEACFCTSVGLGPGAVQGSDLVITAIANGRYYAEILTEKGEILTEAAKDIFQDCVLTDKTPFLAQVPQKFDLRPLQEKLANCYDSPLWIKHSLPCLGCGACAFVCPTCTCFDIQDEGDVYNGIRVRCWDSCGFPLFTLHASGHNPRPVQSNRWRQRMLHKFIYARSQNHVSSCVGCGRCLRACPAQVSIVEQMQSLAEVK